MRINAEQCAVIREEVSRIFGMRAQVRVFGSRTDDNARGGDVDLLVQSDAIIPDPGRKSLQLEARLQMRLGDQPFDVLVLDPVTVVQPVHEQAIRDGIPL